MSDRDQNRSTHAQPNNIIHHNTEWQNNAPHSLAPLPSDLPSVKRSDGRQKQRSAPSKKHSVRPSIIVVDRNLEMVTGGRKGEDRVSPKEEKIPLCGWKSSRVRNGRETHR